MVLPQEEGRRPVDPEIGVRPPQEQESGGEDRRARPAAPAGLGIIREVQPGREDAEKRDEDHAEQREVQEGPVQPILAADGDSPLFGPPRIVESDCGSRDQADQVNGLKNAVRHADPFRRRYLAPRV